jgi:hypothetical protein
MDRLCLHLLGTNHLDVLSEQTVLNVSYIVSIHEAR